MKLLPLILIFLFSSSQVIACEAPPMEQYTSDDELITRTKNIILARVASAKLRENGSVVYTFHAQETIKGKIPETFEIVGEPLWEGGMEHFEHHSIKGARLSYETDCEIHPSFAVGQIYLVFLDKPYHQKSFEFIIRTSGSALVQDKWLQYVKKATAL